MSILMWSDLETTTIQCPYCWEQFETVLDCSSIEPLGESQEYTEDCYICCRPIAFSVSLDHQGYVSVHIEAELDF